MLEVSRLTTEYAITQPLRLSVERGEAVALVGPNGCGKTTLLRAIAGQRDVVSGKITVAGVSIGSTDAIARAALVGFLPQSEPTMAGFSVREAVTLGCYARRGPFNYRADDLVLVDRALESVRISDLGVRDCGTLSGGEYQRVRLARALAQNPEFLILDEPLAHLDPGQSHGVAALIRSLSKSQQQTCLVALHDLNVAALYFDRILLMNDGEIMADGTPNDVMTEDRLRSVYGNNFHVITHPVNGRPQVLGSANICP